MLPEQTKTNPGYSSAGWSLQKSEGSISPSVGSPLPPSVGSPTEVVGTASEEVLSPKKKSLSPVAESVPSILSKSLWQPDESALIRQSSAVERGTAWNLMVDTGSLLMCAVDQCTDLANPKESPQQAVQGRPEEQVTTTVGKSGWRGQQYLAEGAVGEPRPVAAANSIFCSHGHARS